MNVSVENGVGIKEFLLSIMVLLESKLIMKTVKAKSFLGGSGGESEASSFAVPARARSATD